MKIKATCNMPLLGQMTFVEEDGAMTHITLNPGEELEQIQDGESELLKRAKSQMSEYLTGDRKKFDLPLSPRGRAFQQSVWRELRQIPYGETRSYGEIAKAIGNPKSCRAVGFANHNNPLMIVIPCHRVIGADGRLTGYAGGLDVKEKLLALEGIIL